LGQEQIINVWIDDRKGKWDLEEGTDNIDLPILIAYKLRHNWSATIRLISVVNNNEDKRKASKFLNDIVDLARMPITDLEVLEGDMEDLVSNSPKADVNIFCHTDDMSLDYYNRMVDLTKSSCLFIKDSGSENILA